MTGARLRSLAGWIGAGAVAIGWGAWSAEFIRRTSFIAIDGVQRYCLFDDAMISMRYGRNLIEGNGLVWNPGERVEGITNLLMTLYMALLGTLFGKFDSILAVLRPSAVSPREIISVSGTRISFPYLSRLNKGLPRLS